jgi:Family of unknown function (DUF6069)
MTARTRRRLATVVLAPAAALSAWAAYRFAGIDLTVSTGDGMVAAGDVVAAALVGAVAAWFVVRQLERHTRRAGFWWPPLGSMALAISTVGPSWFAEGASEAALVSLHFVTGIVVIVGFATTLPRCSDCRAICLCGGVSRSDPAP